MTLTVEDWPRIPPDETSLQTFFEHLEEANNSINIITLNYIRSVKMEKQKNNIPLEIVVKFQVTKTFASNVFLEF